MGSSPRPAAGGPAALDGTPRTGAPCNGALDADAPGTGALDTRVTPAGVAARVSDLLEGVFDAVAETRADVAALLTAAGADAGAVDGRRPVSGDLAALRPGLHDRLRRLAAVSGMGFVAAPDLLADVPAWVEWWQTGADGAVRPLLLDLDPEHSAYSDYTHWEWYGHPRDTGRRAVAGPYVDYLCSDEYGLTLSVPVTVGERFAGVAGADVYLSRLEAELMPAVQCLHGPAYLVNSRGRIALSTDPGHLAGSLLKGPDLAAALSGPPDGTVHEGLRLLPCGDLPLVLVVRAAGEGAP